MTKKSIKRENHDIDVNLLDIGLALQRITDMIGREEQGIFKALESLDKSMDRMEGRWGYKFIAQEGLGVSATSFPPSAIL
jgi:hypothetical protein